MIMAQAFFPRSNSLENSSCEAGDVAASDRFARTCSTRLMPTKAVVIPGVERTNCSARFRIVFESQCRGDERWQAARQLALQHRRAGHERDAEFGSRLRPSARGARRAAGSIACSASVMPGCNGSCTNRKWCDPRGHVAARAIPSRREKENPVSFSPWRNAFQVATSVEVNFSRRRRRTPEIQTRRARGC